MKLLAFLFALAIVADKPPHLILIVGDDIGFNDLGFFGNNGMPTPNLNNLANTGVILQEQYVQPLCTPSRASLMTGRYPFRYGLSHYVIRQAYDYGLSTDEVTLAQVLRGLGYSTHLVGKWHLGHSRNEYHPLSRGFNSFYGILTGSADHKTKVASINITNAYNFDCQDTSSKCQKMFSSLHAVCRQSEPGQLSIECTKSFTAFEKEGCLNNNDGPDSEMSASFFPTNGSARVLPIADGDIILEGIDFHRGFAKEPVDPTQFTSTVFGNEAIRIIRDHNPEVPLFMHLAFTELHLPMQTDDTFAGNLAACMNGAKRKYPYPPRFQACTMAYGMDRAVGKVVDQLKASGLYDNSIIVFLSDNGGVPFQSSNYPLRGAKMSLLEGGIRVPAFVHSPRYLKETGVVRQGKIHAVDWFTTFIALAEGKENEEPSMDMEENPAEVKIDGKNIWNVVARGTRSPRREIVVNIDPLVSCPTQTLGLPTGNHAAIIVDKWKYFEGDPGNFMLDCYSNDGHSLPPINPAALYCPFPLNEKGEGLVNLEEDPRETTNVADANPAVVTMMRARLNQYRKALVGPIYPADPDPRSDPKLHGGYWEPWAN